MAVLELLKIFLGKLDDMPIKSEEELLILDKIIYKSCNLSKDFKMRLLSPVYQEKFQQRMKDIQLDQANFVNMLKAYEKGKGPYNKSKADIPLTLPPELENAVPKPKPVLDMPQPYKPEALPEKTARRPVEKGGMTPKRAARSSSSSSSSDSDENQGLQVKISKLQNEILRLTAEKGLGEPDPVRPSTKYSFPLKKPEGTGRTPLTHTKDDQYFERTGRATEQLREPRSERGDREYRIEPDAYHSPQRGEGRSKWDGGSGKKAFRSKSYRPPYPFKR